MDLSTWPPEIKAIYESIDKSEFASNNAFKIKVYYGTEATSKTKSDITQLISYDETDETPKTVVKKVEVDKLTNYPLTYTQVAEQIKLKKPQIGKRLIDRIISDNNIKKNQEYAWINFRNKEQEQKYKKDKMIPKSTPIIYKETVVDYIISIYDEEYK